MDFVQEVFATYKTVMEYEPDTDAVIELGGEDAKIIFLSGGLEERMNGSCAGGTGAFIDQMATLLNVTTEELDELSLKHERIYPIASRCGVFAKTDIQPLLNQGARQGGRGRQHLPGGGRPDRHRPEPGPPHRGQGAVSGRAAVLL